ncbi:hypothetical protein BHM03_00053045 [Ensete ventricosum]|nr:hypothetical protein BHM03_00053045 [Ensete ventricosum]
MLHSEIKKMVLEAEVLETIGTYDLGCPFFCLFIIIYNFFIVNLENRKPVIGYNIL